LLRYKSLQEEYCCCGIKAHRRNTVDAVQKLTGGILLLWLNSLQEEYCCCGIKAYRRNTVVVVKKRTGGILLLR